MAIVTSPSSSQHRQADSTILSLNPSPGLLPSTTEGSQDNSIMPIPESTESPRNNVIQNVNTADDTPSMEDCVDPNAHEEGPEKDPSAADGQDLIRNFILYEQTKSTREVNEAIRAELLKFHPATEGCIYGFLYPRNTGVRIGSDSTHNIQIFKIGRSVNVQRRMKEWRKKCKYEPRVVLNIKMPHHHRIERIVHHQLHNSRLREYPGCSGCGLQHNEWFRVSAVYAAFLVNMWRDFAHREPYGEDGELLPDWLERLSQVDLEDPGCWMWFILETSHEGLMSSSSHAEGEGTGSQAL